MIASLLLAAAAAQPSVVATVDPKHRLVEGVATDGTAIFASSVLDGAILSCTTTCRPVATLPDGLHPLGIAWDALRDRLWVAADCPKLPGIAECERGALVAIDRHGRLLSRIAPPTGEFHPGDVSLSDRGTVFVSDSRTGAVYRLLPDRRELQAVVEPGVGKSAQGSALSADGKRLIVADYSHGIAAIDLGSGARTLLPRQDGKPLRGIDGLLRCGDDYLGVYNGAVPGRLLRIRMRSGGVEYSELIEDLTFPDPTQIAFDGKRVLVIPNAGWEAAGKAEEIRNDGARIVAIPVGSNCEPL